MNPSIKPQMNVDKGHALEDYEPACQLVKSRPAERSIASPNCAQSCRNAASSNRPIELRLEREGVERIARAHHEVLLTINQKSLRPVAEIVGEPGMPKDVTI